jgi:hypothetical protein
VKDTRGSRMPAGGYGRDGDLHSEEVTRRLQKTWELRFAWREDGG